MKTTKVLMFGTDVSATGGIASVVKDYFDFGLMSRLNIDYIPTYRDGSKVAIVLYFLAQAPKILIRSLSVDIVHAQAAHYGSFRRLGGLTILAHLLGKKTVMHIHGSDFHIYYDNASFIERKFIEYTLRISDCVIVLSQDWKEKLQKIQPNANYVIVRNGIESKKYQCPERALHDPANVLFLGELGERKGVYDLVEAANRLDKSKYTFVLAGNGDIEGVRSRVLELGLDDTVDVPGWIGPEKKKELLRDADLYVLPSFNEGLPISILEAMAAGLPVVSTPVGGIPEAVIDGHNGYLVNPGDPPALADCIHKATSNSSRWKNMSDMTTALARESFSMEMVEKELIKIYAAITDTGSVLKSADSPDFLAEEKQDS